MRLQYTRPLTHAAVEAGIVDFQTRHGSLPSQVTFGSQALEDYLVDIKPERRYVVNPDYFEVGGRRLPRIENVGDLSIYAAGQEISVKVDLDAAPEFVSFQRVD